MVTAGKQNDPIILIFFDGLGPKDTMVTAIKHDDNTILVFLAD